VSRRMVAGNIIRMHLTFNARLDIGAQIFRKLIALRRVILLALEPLVEQRRHHTAHFGGLKFFVIGRFQLIGVFNYLLTLYLRKVFVRHVAESTLLEGESEDGQFKSVFRAFILHSAPCPHPLVQRLIAALLATPLPITTSPPLPSPPPPLPSSERATPRAPTHLRA
jgi:hypothetical protein